MLSIADDLLRKVKEIVSAKQLSLTIGFQFLVHLDFLSLVTRALIQEGKTEKQSLRSKDSNSKKNRLTKRKISFALSNNTRPTFLLLVIEQGALYVV